MLHGTIAARYITCGAHRREEPKLIEVIVKALIYAIQGHQVVIKKENSANS